MWRETKKKKFMTGRGRTKKKKKTERKGTEGVEVTSVEDSRNIRK